MKTKIYALAAVVPLLLVACASDPNKEANDAHNAELKSERKGRQNAADDRADDQVKSADREQKMTSASASGSDATKERVDADAKLKEARDVARAKANERLEKADARTTELKTIVDRKGAKATTASRDLLSSVDKQRAAAVQSIAQIDGSSSDNLDAAKKNADSQLDALEGFVKKAANEVDKFK